jgi:cation diffusion facilitator family transporter
LAGQKPDPDHPFGHGRIEYISGLMVAFLILLMAFELVKSSVDKILHPTEVEATPLIIAILVVSVFVKLYMFFYNNRVGKNIDSAAMLATAKDSVSDALATTMILLTTLLAKYTGLRIDGYCGLAVALIVFWAGISAARDTISPLLGQPPEPEFVEKIEEIIMSYEDRGVIGIHDLVVHNYGPGRVMLSVHVEVPSSGDILALHDMIDLIEHRLKNELECSAVIHMDPACVDDEATMMFMKAFYSERYKDPASGTDIYKAFNAARQQMKKGGQVSVNRFSSNSLTRKPKSRSVDSPRYSDAFILIDGI